jgi:MFS family permease
MCEQQVGTRPACRSYRNYLLGVLMATLVLNKVEHASLGVLMQSIKTDLALTDTQLGLLTGIAFTLFYSIMGIPIARWADRGNRVTIISLATALQCAAVALCGVATSFLQLLVVRIGVAVGEAGCIPPANSLIADHFSRAERPRATARYTLGYPLSAVIGYLVAGWLNEHYGWRATFMFLGLPGLAVAAVAYFTLHEPRLGAEVKQRALPPAPKLTQVSMTLWRNATFRQLLIGYSLVNLFGIGLATWGPAFFVRSYGLGTSELGVWFALVWGMAGFFGTYLGGELAARYAAGNERLQIQFVALAYAVFGAISAGIYLSPNQYLAFGLLGLTAAANYATCGPLFATIQTLVPERMRAVAFAAIYLFVNLIGVGLGPLIAGALSDALQPRFGQEALRYSLLALSPGYVWAAWHLWRASRTVARDVEAAHV